VTKHTWWLSLTAMTVSILGCTNHTHRDTGASPERKDAQDKAAVCPALRGPSLPAAAGAPDRPTTRAAQDPFATGCGQWYGLFNLPSAQYRRNKTYVVYPDKAQNPVAVCYDHALRRWSEPVVVGRKPLVNDDHGNPAMLIDRKGYLHVFYGCHVGPMRYARSARPEDISGWTDMPDPAPHATYPQVMQMANGMICLFYRNGGHTADWVCRTSDDGGDTWSDETAIIHGVPPRESWYVQFAKGPNDTVHVGFVWKDDTNGLAAPGPEFMHRYDLFYLWRDSQGTWRNAVGRPLSLPLSKADAYRLCRAYDSQARHEFTGGCSLGVDEHGKPYLLFRTASAYGTTAYRHKLAAWNGKAWDVTDVGPAVDCGFADFPRDDNFLLQVLPFSQLRAYLVNMTNGTPVETNIEQWDSANGGRAWHLTRTIFRSTTEPAAYVLLAPKLVVDAHPDARLVFGCGCRYLFGDAGYLGR
jgi:hypothetical protein